MTGTFRNRKNGRLYVALGEVRDCTNATDGRRMVMYSADGMLFVRDLDEFAAKFDPHVEPPRGCRRCGGDGTIDVSWHGNETCPTCDGTGTEPRCAHTDAGPDRLAGWMRCPACGLTWEQ